MEKKELTGGLCTRKNLSVLKKKIREEIKEKKVSDGLRFTQKKSICISKKWEKEVTDGFCTQKNPFAFQRNRRRNKRERSNWPCFRSCIYWTSLHRSSFTKAILISCTVIGHKNVHSLYKSLTTPSKTCHLP